MEGLKVKHTAGPWWVDNGQDDGKGILILAPGADESNGIANVFADEVGESEAKANAHLIASAPELLGVCNEVLAVLNEGIEDDPKALEWVKGLLIGVIAKAEGRA